MTGVESPDPMEAETLAAEYVLGLLEGEELRAAERRLADDPAFAAEVAEWWERLSVLLEAEPGRAPPPTLWPRIEAALDQAAQRASAPVQRPSTPTQAASERPPAARPAPVEQQPRRVREAPPEPRRRPGVGRLLAAALAGAAVAGAAAVGYFAYREWSAPQPEALLMATLTPPEGEALYVAALDTERRAVVVTPTRVLPADDRARELWIIPADGAPRSAGLLGATDQPSAVALEGELYRLAQTGVTLAVSLEPPGGSPTGQPTGPVIASGALVQVG